MFKKIVVPFFSLAIATFGCSSSTTPTTGSGGAGGGKGGGAGSAATGSGGGAGSTATGTGGAGGKGGGAGTSGGGTSGGGTSGGGTSGGGTNGGGGSKADAGHAMADCTVVTSGGTDVLTAQVFCENQLAYCSNVTGVTLPYTTMADCETYFTKSGQEHCRSYHLCWGVEGISMEGGAGNPKVHCPHTYGVGLCQAVGDAATGN
ncbi:MAG TPA: hypothetical protein VKZ18_19055 [Polyangia bacterium]|nr:hypothetical protein [Polyangia bacterium]